MCKVSTTTQTYNGKTYTYYCVYKGGKRYTFKTKQDAKDFIEGDVELQRVLRKDVASLISQNPHPFERAAVLLETNGCDISELVDAVEEYVSRQSPHTKVSLGKCVDLYLKFLEHRTSKSTQTCAAQACKILVDHFGYDENPRLHSKYEMADVLDKLLPMDKYSPRTFNSIVSRLRTFARWSYRHGGSVDGNIFDSVELRNVPAKEPVFVTPREIHALIDACKIIFPRELMRDAAAYIALTFFSGIRRSEIIALKPEDFNFEVENPHIRVSTAKGASRGRRGRCVPLEPEAACVLRRAFIRVAIGAERMKPGEIFKDGHLWLKKAAKFAEEMDPANKGLSKRLKNTGRHSFITYHVARHDNIEKTVTICGTSKEMAAVHYRGLATKSEAEEYFLEARYLASVLPSAIY